MTEQVKDRWDSSFSWLRCPRTSKSHGCKNQESCSVSSVPWQGQSQPTPALPLTLQAVTEALTENTVIPQLFSTSSEVLPYPGACHTSERPATSFTYFYCIRSMNWRHCISLFSSPIHQAGISLLLVLCPFLDKDIQETLKNNFTFSFFFKEEFHAFSMSKPQDSSCCHL